MHYNNKLIAVLALAAGAASAQEQLPFEVTNGFRFAANTVMFEASNLPRPLAVATPEGAEKVAAEEASNYNNYDTQALVLGFSSGRDDPGSGHAGSASRPGPRRRADHGDGHSPRGGGCPSGRAHWGCRRHRDRPTVRGAGAVERLRSRVGLT